MRCRMWAYVRALCRLQAGYASREAECRPLARGQSAAGGNKSAKPDLAQDVTAYQRRLDSAQALVALLGYTDDRCLLQVPC